VYASNSGVLGLLGLARLPGVTVGDITQSIESASMSVQNKARRAGCLQAARCDAAGGLALTPTLVAPASSPYPCAPGGLPAPTARQRGASGRRLPPSLGVPEPARAYGEPADAGARAAAAQVELSGPFSRTALTTSASYELRSPKRLQARGGPACSLSARRGWSHAAIEAC